jgi:hypothetical protein
MASEYAVESIGLCEHAMRNASAGQEAVNMAAASSWYRMQAQSSLALCLQKLETVKSNENLRQREFVNARALMEAVMHEGHDELAAYRRMVSNYQAHELVRRDALARKSCINSRPCGSQRWQAPTAGQGGNAEQMRWLSKSSQLSLASSALQRSRLAIRSVP